MWSCKTKIIFIVNCIQQFGLLLSCGNTWKNYVRLMSVWCCLTSPLPNSLRNFCLFTLCTIIIWPKKKKIAYEFLQCPKAWEKLYVDIVLLFWKLYMSLVICQWYPLLWLNYKSYSTRVCFFFASPVIVSVSVYCWCIDDNSKTFWIDMFAAGDSRVWF